MFFLIPLWKAFLSILVPKWFRKGCFWEAFRPLFGDSEPIAEKCVFWRKLYTLAMFHPPRRAPKSYFFGLVFGTCSEGGLRDDFFKDWPSQMELSPTRGAYFEKITFFASESIWDEIWRENDSKRGANMIPKINKKVNAFLIEKSSDCWPPFEHKREPKWEQRATKMVKKGI